MKRIEYNNDQISVKRQCELLDVNRSRIYYKKKPFSTDDVDIMNEMRDVYVSYPFLGYRKLHAILRRNGRAHNLKKTERLAGLAGLKAIYQKKRTTLRDKTHSVYPYLLRDLEIARPNQVWQVDITYIKVGHGFVYLVALIDVFSRRIMGWSLSPFLDTMPCIEALENALREVTPEIVNSDQGAQFTSRLWCDKVESLKIKISMDGKGRWADNVYIERFWRSAKYEEVNLHGYETVQQARSSLAKYIMFYNSQRPHQALGYRTPDQVFEHGRKKEFTHKFDLTFGRPLTNFKVSEILGQIVS